MSSLLLGILLLKLLDLELFTFGGYIDAPHDEMWTPMVRLVI